VQLTGRKNPGECVIPEKRRARDVGVGVGQRIDRSRSVSHIGIGDEEHLAITSSSPAVDGGGVTDIRLRRQQHVRMGTEGGSLIGIHAVVDHHDL
jgi:hypothetical protein